MSQPSDEFDSLRRLLALKRFETPPPGYFDQLSPRVLARISTANEALAQQPWWRRVFPLELVDRVLTTPNAFTIAGLALVGVSLALVLNSDRPASPSLGGGIPLSAAVRSTAGIPDPGSMGPAANWSSIGDSVSTTYTLQLNVVDGVTNIEGAPPSLFAVPAIRAFRGAFRVNYSLDAR
jgi:hypothetical protein